MSSAEPVTREQLDRLRRTLFAAVLGVGTVIALALPFLWDDSSSFKEPISVVGWRLLTYDHLFAGAGVDLFPRIVPILIVLSAVKFWMVIAFFMHLKFDHVSFSWYFGGGLALALAMSSSVVVLQIATHGLPHGY